MMHCYVCYIVHCYGLPQHALGDVQDKRDVHLVSLYFRAATTIPVSGLLFIVILAPSCRRVACWNLP